jgi:hypothetical protein
MGTDGAFGNFSLKYNTGYENGALAHPNFAAGGKNVDARGAEFALDEVKLIPPHSKEQNPQQAEQGHAAKNSAVCIASGECSSRF